MAEKKYSKLEIESNIIRSLKQVYDPDIQVNIYDLGLVYEIKVDADKGSVFIKMTLTSPTCPIADDIVRDVEQAVRDVPCVEDVNIELTFTPEWGIHCMSDEAKLELGLL